MTTKLTLLGSGDAVGMPAPMCDCEYCDQSERRRRPGLLVETDESTVVLDTSPDIKEQLHHEGVTEVDAFLVTHFHFDHFWGVQELGHATLSDRDHVANPEDFDYGDAHDRGLVMYGNPRTREHFERVHIYGTREENIDFRVLERDETVDVGDVTVRTFGIVHGEEGTNQGYVVETADGTVGYAPDARRLVESETYRDLDVFFVEGQLFDARGHADPDTLRRQIKNARPDRVVLLNISEHFNRAHTDQLKREASHRGYEIWGDFMSIQLVGETPR